LRLNSIREAKNKDLRRFGKDLRRTTGVSPQSPSDLRESHRRALLGEELSCDIAWKYLRKEEVTPILHELIVRSSLPLGDFPVVKQEARKHSTS
jgi:hypothetical protein